MQQINTPVLGFERFENEYASILRFARENNHIGFAKFDTATIHRVNLFALRENYDFTALEEALDRIVKTLPAIRRIFARPITRLKDSNEIVPVESVRVINSQTIVHASVHSELWSELNQNGVKPKKLLTVKNEDSYATYENIGFVKLIDCILQLVHHNMHLLQDILFANRNMKFNLLERENHLAYFLAVGKLHIGYVRDYDKYRMQSERCMDKLLFIDRVLSARLGTPIYRQCKKLTGKFALKKSTVFRVHKDYHQIYLLLKWFSDNNLEGMETEQETSVGMREGYDTFCSLLSLFAVGHFNFVFSEDKPIDFFHLNTECSCYDWKLHIETIFCADLSALLFTFRKDACYKILLIPSPGGSQRRKKALARFKQQCSANEYLFADPVRADGNRVYLSLFDIESFRRLQQLLLRGMVYSDVTRNVCPFCGGALTLETEDVQNVKSIHTCDSCRQQIIYAVCPNTQKPYFATQIKNFTPSDEDFTATGRRDRLLYNKYVEGQLFYRNITPIKEGADIVCPRCKKSHDYMKTDANN